MNRTQSLRQSFLRQLLMGIGVAASIYAGAGCCLEKSGTRCIEIEEGESCPTKREAIAEFPSADFIEDGPWYENGATYYLDGVAYEEPGECCYEVNYGVECDAPNGFGRAYIDDDKMLRAAARRATSRKWSAKLAPHVASLTPEQRAAKASQWTDRGLAEHAAVASLGRFALELLGFGADPELIAAAQQAASEELLHAKLCFGLASAYGAPVEPDAFPFAAGRIDVAPTLTELARRTVLEGCIDETLGVIELSQRIEACHDEVERQVLLTLLRDERRHALLAWRTIRWAIDQGGEPVRCAVAEVFASFEVAPSAKQTWDEVIAPCVQSLQAA